MQYTELKNELKNFLIFSIKDIEKVDFDFHKQRLSEWQKDGYIKKICQGFYLFSDIELNEKILAIVANRIYEPSYISLEIALSLYGIIPEAVYGVTSITTQNTKRLHSLVGDFVYRHVKPELFFGYELREYKGQKYQIAEIEKAILDYLYLNPKISDNDSFEGMRFNILEIKEKIDEEKFRRYADAFASRALGRRAELFLHYIHTHA